MPSDKALVRILFRIPSAAGLAALPEGTRIWLARSTDPDQSARAAIMSRASLTIFDDDPADPLGSLIDIVASVVEHHPEAEISFDASDLLPSLRD